MFEYGGSNKALEEMMRRGQRQRDFDRGLVSSLRVKRTAQKPQKKRNNKRHNSTTSTHKSQPKKVEPKYNPKQDILEHRATIASEYGLLPTDEMKLFLNVVSLIEPNFPKLFHRMNQYQEDQGGRRFTSVSQFTGIMLELHLEECTEWVSQQEQFSYVTGPLIREGDFISGHRINYGALSGTYVFDKYTKEENEIDCVRIVDGVPLGIETTISKRSASSLRKRAKVKQRYLNRIYNSDCGMAVMVPMDVYEGITQATEVVNKDGTFEYIPTSNLAKLEAEGGIIIPFNFTREEFTEQMLDFAQGELKRAELVQGYERAELVQSKLLIGYSQAS